MRTRFLLAVFATLVAASPPPSRNPIFPGADPDLIAACGRWWIYPTNPTDPADGRSATRFYAWSSPDLKHWTRSTSLLEMNAIPWVAADGAPDHGLWAPSLTAANGRYFLYFAVGPQNLTPSRLGVAVADTPAGPFLDSGMPILKGGPGFEAIDPMVFVDPKDGQAYLYSGGSAGATLRIFTLKPDMTEIDKEVPVATPPNFTEGAFVHERAGIYYLSYSHGHWDGPDYSVHYATSTSPVGPWTYRGAILTADATHQGPGHHAFAENPVTHQWYIAYHRWERGPGAGPYRGDRQVAVDAIHYAPDGSILPVKMTDTAPPNSPLPSSSCQDSSR